MERRSERGGDAGYVGFGDPVRALLLMYDISSIITVTFTAKMETTKAQIVALVDPFIASP